MRDRAAYDVVVVGGGTAGGVLAARLSEDPRRRVALVEWVRDDATEPQALQILGLPRDRLRARDRGRGAVGWVSGRPSWCAGACRCLWNCGY
jgi:choline dehydrogenase-like flavoprotein